ncbi:hypothetical protein M514_13067, partial [Trichuris suis]
AIVLPFATFPLLCKADHLFFDHFFAEKLFQLQHEQREHVLDHCPSVLSTHEEVQRM